MTISEQKIHVREQLDDLIKEGVIKNDAQVAREIGISKSAISAMLSPSSKKRVSQRFILELEKKYFNKQEHSQDELKEIVATQKVLLETCAQLLSQTSGKAFSTVLAELKQAVKMNVV